MDVYFHYTFNPATGAWAYANPQGLVDLGVVSDAARASTLSWTSAIIDDSLASYERAVQAALSTGVTSRLRYQVRMASGAAVKVIDHLAVMRAEGKWPLIVGIVFRDDGHTTAIQKAERQALVGRLAGGMIHDFRNLLAGVQNIVEWCGSRSGGDAAVQEALLNSVRYIDRANAIINGLLRLMGGKGREEEAEGPIDIGGVVLELEPLIRHLMPTSVAIQLSLVPGVPRVFGRRGALQDMVLNICTNAKDAMPEGGTLSLAVVSIDDTAGGGVLLRIEDSGYGMPPEMLETIFDAFYSTKEVGAGLGLWMVREAVKSFNAKIDVRSEVGRGTAFEICFPASSLAPAPASSSVPAEEKAVRQRKGGTGKGKGRGGKRRAVSVLLIEDEPLIRDGVAGWLESNGFRVQIAGDGAAGWRIFEEGGREVDLVIQDYMLPGGRDGEALLRRFLASRPDLPVIVTSGHPDEGIQASLCEAGAFAFLSKPFKLDELDKLIGRALHAGSRHRQG